MIRGSTPRLIVSLTTIPSRIAHVPRVIQTLLANQTTKPDLVVVHVPQEYCDAALGDVRTLPVFFRTCGDARISVNRKCENVGPATKLAGMSDVDLHADDLIVYIDDDQDLHPDLLRRHVQAQQLYERHVFCTRGSMLDLHAPDRCAVSFPPMLRVDVPEGYGSVSVHARDIDFAQLKAELAAARSVPALYFSDDLLLGNLFWQSGLTVRLLPVMLPSRGEFKHSADCMALGTGRSGSMSGTKPRMLQALRALQRQAKCCLPGLGVGRRDSHRLAGVPGVLASMHDFTGAPGPAVRKADIAVVLFAFNRPDYLARVLGSLRADRCDVHIFVDGIVNPYSGCQRSPVSPVAHTVRLARDVPGAHVFQGASNYGVGLMQFFAAHRVFCELKYPAAIFLEDDLVLGQSYIPSVLALLPTLANTPCLSAVQAGYRQLDANPNSIRLLDARQEHVHYWGWATTRAKFAAIYDTYSRAVLALFSKVDYVMRNDTPADPLGRWFRERGLEPDHRSQDWVRDACFRLAGMTHKLVCARRRAAPIGERGLHCNPRMFRAMGLDSSTRDIDQPPVFAAGHFVLGLAVPIWIADANVPARLRDCLAHTVRMPAADHIVVTTDGAFAPPINHRAVVVCLPGTSDERRRAFLAGRQAANTHLVADGSTARRIRASALALRFPIQVLDADLGLSLEAAVRLFYFPARPVTVEATTRHVVTRRVRPARY